MVGSVFFLHKKMHLKGCVQLLGCTSFGDGVFLCVVRVKTWNSLAMAVSEAMGQVLIPAPISANYARLDMTHW
jgi:hypothetical protein